MLWCGAGGIPHVTLCRVNQMHITPNSGHLVLLDAVWGRGQDCVGMRS